MTDPADDIGALAPESTAVEAGGERLEIRPMLVGQIARVLKLGAPLLAELNAIKPDSDDAAMDLAMLAFAAGHGEALIGVVAAAIDKPVEWVAALPQGEFLRLCDVVLNRNRDFFLRALGPTLRRLLARWMPSPPPGRPSSSDS